MSPPLDGGCGTGPQYGRVTVLEDIGGPGGPLVLRADPRQPMDAATMCWTARHTNELVCQAIQALLQTYPSVWSWNGRVGDVWLTVEDINRALDAGGIPILVPTPGPGAPPGEVPNLEWVRDYVATVLAGPPAYATQAWVTSQLAGMVISFNGRTGAISLTLPDVTGVGGAPIASPNFTGIPAAPTANPGTSTAQLATTAFVMAAVTSATTGVISFNGRTGAVELDSQDVYDAGAALQVSPAFTGTPTAPTASPGTATTQLATTAFVAAAVAASTAGVAAFNGRTGDVTLVAADISAASGALTISPAFQGIPTAPTAANGTNTTQLATTAFVQNAITAVDAGVTTFNGRSGAVTLLANDITAAGGLANPSVNLTGVPLAPTAIPGTNTTQIATTAFVTQALSTVSGIIVAASPPATPSGGQGWFNTNDAQLYIWNGTAWIIAVNPPTPDLSGYAQLGGATFTGPVSLPAGSTVAGYLPLSGGAMSGGITWNVSGLPNSGPTSLAFGWDATVNSFMAAIPIASNGSVNGYMVRGFASAPNYAVIGIVTTGTSLVAQLANNTTLTWSATPSDRRLKSNLAPPPDALAAVNGIEVRTCDFTAPGDGIKEHWDYTLIADEVQRRLPFAYIEPPENGYASLHPLHLISTLWRAVQQLSGRLQQLEAQRA